MNQQSPWKNSTHNKNPVTRLDFNVVVNMVAKVEACLSCILGFKAYFTFVKMA